MAVKRFAFIDVGSFELELGIYEMEKTRGLRLIDSVRHVIPMGSDTYSTGVISAERIRELISVLEDFQKIAKGYRCNICRAVATSAMREAKNGAVILDRIRTRTGIDVQIISNSEQRMMTFKALDGRREHFETLIKDGTAIAEIGFGSIQITLYDKGKMIGTQNLKLGALRIRDTLERLSCAPGEKKELMEEVADQELEIYGRLHLRERKIKNLIAVGDPIRLIYNRLVKRADRDSEKENLLPRVDAERLFSYVTERTREELEQKLDVGVGIAEVLIPSALICERMLRVLNVERVWFAGIGLIDGIAADYALAHKILTSEHDFDADMISAAKKIGARYGEDSVQRNYALENTMQLFDSLKRIQHFRERDRLLLLIAAHLRHCGRFVNMGKVNASGYHIVRMTEIAGLSAEEHELISQILKNEEGDILWPEMSMRASKLIAIMRLSDALDRSAKQKAGGYKMALNDEHQLIITANQAGKLMLEALAFEKNKAFFSEIFGIEPILREKRKK